MTQGAGPTNYGRRSDETRRQITMEKTVVTSQSSRPIRFSLGAELASDRAEILASARNAQEAGFSAFAVADHFSNPLSPLIALQAIADETTDLRLTMNVLNHDFRHPAVVAKDLATLDVMSGGRVDVGVGAGWKKEEYQQAGMAYDKPSVRIERLEEYVIILKGLFAPEPFSFSGKYYRISDLDGSPKPLQPAGPKIMIGGGGRKLLSMAARHADIVQIVPGQRPDFPVDPDQFTAQAFEEKLGWVRSAAGDRLDEIELGTLLLDLVITDDQETGVNAVLEKYATALSEVGAAFTLTARDIIESPVFAIGSVEQICEKLRSTRDRFGLSYFSSAYSCDVDSYVRVIKELARSE